MEAIVIGADLAYEDSRDFMAACWIRLNPKPVTFFEANSEGGRFGRIRWRNQGIMESQSFGRVWWDKQWPKTFMTRVLERLSVITGADGMLLVRDFS